MRRTLKPTPVRAEPVDTRLFLLPAGRVIFQGCGDHDRQRLFGALTHGGVRRQQIVPDPLGRALQYTQDRIAHLVSHASAMERM